MSKGMQTMVGHQIQRLGRSASPLIGDRYAELLAAHRVVVLAALRRHVGSRLTRRASRSSRRSEKQGPRPRHQPRSATGWAMVRSACGSIHASRWSPTRATLVSRFTALRRIAAAALVARFDASRELLRGGQDRRVRLCVVLELAQGLVANSPSAGWAGNWRRFTDCRNRNA